MCKSLGSDQILPELNKAGCETLVSVINKAFNSIWNNEELIVHWKEYIIVSIHKMGDKTDCNNYRGISLLSISHKILSNIALSWLNPYMYIYMKLMGTIHVDFNITDQLLIRFSAFVRY
jgi:arginine exporter protein ArgO